MAWIAPVTNRTSSKSRTTYIDMNRICGNINYLFPDAKLKTNWTRADIVDRASWDNIIQIVSALGNSVGIEINYSSDYINLNNIETVTLRRYSLLATAYKIPVRFSGVRFGEREIYEPVIVTFKTPFKFSGAQF